MTQIEADFERTVQFLYAQLPMFQRDGAAAYKKDLSNTIKLCNYLDNPQNRFKSIHVAGTNGKGSSSHYLAAILQAAGYKTGLYTSPHLKTFTERIKINGQEIEQAFVIDFVERIKPIVSEINPSFFEITVAMCFDYFAKNSVDVAIIEVGMGGRLDSTSIINPELALITNISLDHQQWLGNTLNEIAKEKAGIIKTKAPVVISEIQSEVAEIFKLVSISKQASLYFAPDYYEVKVDDGFSFHFNGAEFQLSTQTGASYQSKNITGVLKCIELLQKQGFVISDKQLQIGLEQAFQMTGLKGRWQKLSENPLTFCDVGHNETGIHYVMRQINTYSYHELHIVLGVVADKELSSILSLFPKEAHYYFCQPNIPRALPAKKLSEEAHKFGLSGEVVINVNEAIENAKQNASKDDFIFIGGSNFVVAEIDNL